MSLSPGKTLLLAVLVFASVTASIWMLAASERAGIVVSLLAGAGGYLLLLMEWRRNAARRELRDARWELAESLQVVTSEAEAREVVRRHLERVVPGATATLLPPHTRGEPQSCLAIRLGRIQKHDVGRPPLLSCEICGESPDAAVCVPAIVGGHVTGAVVVERSDGQAFDAAVVEQVTESLAQAAPVLANLRNVALAETRAAIDALTGLPNSLALRDTLRRMIAQAERTVTPLAAILIDLDHLRRINDTHGHDRGDDVLAAVGEVLASAVRASDYAGRFGGEEFLVLLPDTDREGAMLVAEKLRRVIAGLRLPGLDRPLSASLGVASLSPEGGDADALLRLASRALYAAKAAGRNRVEAAGLTVATAD